MASSKDAVGSVYGRLTLKAKFLGKASGQRRMMGVCTCSCGEEVTLPMNNLGRPTKSCGCIVKSQEGLSSSPEYRAWKDMLARCTKPDHPDYESYRLRAPTVRWLNFSNFLADMGKRPEGYSLERINNDKGYSPENCKWIPMAEQAKNRSDVRLVTKEGLAVPLSTACSMEGLHRWAVDTKLRNGASIQEALPGWSWSGATVTKRPEADKSLA